MCGVVLFHYLVIPQDILDADDNPLIDRSGRKMERDIVQFVPLRQFYSKSGANFSLVSKLISTNHYTL